MADPEAGLDLLVELAFCDPGVGEENGQKNYESANNTESLESGLH
jgi:hypothetical protein